MEKKRSARSSPGILPRSPLIYENYKAGCAWRLINFFDFRQIRSGKRLISDKSKGFRDSAGNVYTKSQLDLLRKLHEKCQCTNNTNTNAQRLVNEETSLKSKPKRRSSVIGTEQEKEKSYPKSKYPKEEAFDNLIQIQKQSSLIESEKSENTTDDKQMNLKKGRNQEINLHVCMNETAEGLIGSKGKKGKFHGRDIGNEQFLEALDVLSSNKELFVTLLQDPNSFSTKSGQERESKSTFKAESFETRTKERRESDDFDRIVLLKPRLTNSGEDNNAYLRFKHLAKKLKLVVGSNKNNCSESKLEEREFQRRSDASTNTISRKSQDLSIFKRKKRVESDVFKLSPENNDVSMRRFMVERQYERTNSSPIYEVPQKLDNEKHRYRLRISSKNGKVLNPNQDYHLDEDRYRGYINPRFDMEEECLEQRYSRSSYAECCKDNHSKIVETNTLFSDFSSPERSNCNVNDLKQEQEHPSPVSVLARIHMDDDTTSLGNVKHPSTEEQIGFSYDPNVDLKSILKTGSIQEFVKIILETSGLNWIDLHAKCSDSSLESSLLNKFSDNNNNNSNNQRLVLDYTNEILNETYINNIKSWPFIRLKNSKLVPSSLKIDLIDHIMKSFDWSLLCESNPPRSLEQLMEKDLTKPCLWMDFGGETESVVSDLVEHILEQLEIEIAGELGAMPITRIFMY